MHTPKPVKQIEKTVGQVVKEAELLRDSATLKFPWLFVGLSTFGLVATLYGFEKVIDQVPFFANNPWAVLLAGLATLVITGTLYKKLN